MLRECQKPDIEYEQLLPAGIAHRLSEGLTVDDE